MATVAFLSPHLDDAVFSCWYVLRSSRDVVALNVFTAVSPPGQATPRWDRITGADDPAARMRLRLEEDAAALALAGRRAANLHFVDSQYRDLGVALAGDGRERSRRRARTGPVSRRWRPASRLTHPQLLRFEVIFAPGPTAEKPSYTSTTAGL